MRHVWITCLLSLTAGSLYAQVTGTVRGKLGTGKSEILPGATLVWAGTRSGTVADDQGKFSISPAPGAQQLVVSYVGYLTDTIAFSGTGELSILLEPEMGKGVEVHGRMEATQINTRDPLRFQTITEKELCKAACCNLSESFETNASIDAAFTDAVTGTRQIRMLGLEGRYTQVMFDNVPAVRGLASTYGLTYVPGPWIKSIVIAKGAGSVLSGYESMAGQINVAHKNADNAEKMQVNAYAGSWGRMELNLVWNPRYDRVHAPSDSRLSLYPTLLAHGAFSDTRTDMNEDGFMDNPLFANVILRNEWVLETPGGLGGHYAVTWMNLRNTSGQLEYSPADDIRSRLWGANLTTRRLDAMAKTGYTFREKDWKSIGSQLSYTLHDQEGRYGYRMYKGWESDVRINLLYASRFSENHSCTAALNYQRNDFRESLYQGSDTALLFTPYLLDRLEETAGGAMEYTARHKEWFVLVAGIRADHHNRFNWLITPRLHARFSLSPELSFKVSAGKGYRTPQVLMDNVGMLASNREILMEGFNGRFPFGLDMEESWNTGILLSYTTEIHYRPAVLTFDFFRTDFENQVVMDIETAREVRFYNLSGPSYSNSAQMEFHWSPFRRTDVRLAYRWLDVKTNYSAGLLEKPLVNRHRAFTNIAYETKAGEQGQQWRFDLTAQWISSKRIPLSGEHAAHMTPARSDPFMLINAQATLVLRTNLEIYAGGENLTNFMQHDPIISGENPSSENFDASLIWGPVFGRMAYLGLRWKIEGSSE
jgi:hypothetical protein